MTPTTVAEIERLRRERASTSRNDEMGDAEGVVAA
jgi:hypothetical protein